MENVILINQDKPKSWTLRSFFFVGFNWFVYLFIFVFLEELFLNVEIQYNNRKKRFILFQTFRKASVKNF